MSDLLLKSCPLCQGYFDDQEAQLIVVRSGAVGSAAQRMAICHSCRMKLCICGRCTAYTCTSGHQAGIRGRCYGTGVCREKSPRAIYEYIPGGDGGYEPSNGFESDWCPVDANEGCRADWQQAFPWTWDDIRQVFGGELPCEAGTPAPETTNLIESPTREVVAAALRIAREMRRQPEREWQTSEFHSFATAEEPSLPIIDAALSLLLNNHEITLASDSEGLWQWDGRD